MKCVLIRDMTCRPTDEFPDGIKKSGTEIDHPQAAILVRMGVAKPADEECERAAGMTPETMEAARHAYERVSRGIIPEDYWAFDQGIMSGYNPDGSWKPGPNYADHEWEVRKRNSPIIIDD